jgi:hypothetical protein
VPRYPDELAKYHIFILHLRVLVLWGQIETRYEHFPRVFFVEFCLFAWSSERPPLVRFGHRRGSDLASGVVCAKTIDQ